MTYASQNEVLGKNSTMLIFVLLILIFIGLALGSAFPDGYFQINECK